MASAAQCNSSGCDYAQIRFYHRLIVLLARADYVARLSEVRVKTECENVVFGKSLGLAKFEPHGVVVK